MERRIIDKQGNILLSTLSDDCIECIINNITNGYARIQCKKDSIIKRIGYISGLHGQCYCCDARERLTTANFKSLLANTLDSIPQIHRLHAEINEQIIESETQRINQVLHNIKGLHAQSIQELSPFIPQPVGKLSNSLRNTKQLIKNNIDNVALTMLRLAKINNGIKAELSIYEKFIQSKDSSFTLNSKLYKIQDVVFLIAQPFFEDFHKKNVWVDLNEDFGGKAFIDFETFFSALYHIFGNATKYVRPNTKVDVSFAQFNNNCSIRFSMESFYVFPEETSKIFNDGYSGIQARISSLSGNGIGMYRAKQLIELNHGTISFQAGNVVRRENGIDYAVNVIEILLPISSY